MEIVNRMKHRIAASKMRNMKCQCGSDLKFKHCHGDPEKRKIVATIANVAMSVLIHHRRYAAGLETEAECDTAVGKLQEAMYNLLDPDYVPPEPEKAEVVESEDKKCEDEEEAEPEPEGPTGTAKIDGIRESAGVDRCPKCLGVKMIGEDMCYKCKKGS